MFSVLCLFLLPFFNLLKLLCIYRRKFVDLSFEKYHFTTHCLVLLYCIRFAVGVFILCSFGRRDTDVRRKRKPVFKNQTKEWDGEEKNWKQLQREKNVKKSKSLVDGVLWRNQYTLLCLFL